MYHYWQVVSDVVRDIPFAQRQWKPIRVEKFVFEDASRPAYYASVFFEGWPRNYAFTTSPKPLPTKFRVSAELEVLGLQTDDYLLLWARNPQYIWIYDREGRKPNRQEPGRLTLAAVSDGRYSVLWRETTTGEVLSQEEVTAAGGRLVLRSPAITRSAVARLVKR